MGADIQGAVHLLHAALHHYGYLALLVLAFLSAGYLPVPGGLVAATAGGLVGIGHFHAAEALAFIVAGAVIGDLGRYAISRKFTSRRTWDRRDAEFASLRRLDRLLKRRPLATIAVSRFVPFARGGVDSLSGMSRVKLAHFIPGVVIGDLAYAALFLALGFAFGRAWDNARVAVSIVTTTAFLLGAATVVSVVRFPGLTKERRRLRS
jgi:membrane protein DedA with SNARE-associated domain